MKSFHAADTQNRKTWQLSTGTECITFVAQFHPVAQKVNKSINQGGKGGIVMFLVNQFFLLDISL